MPKSHFNAIIFNALLIEWLKATKNLTLAYEQLCKEELNSEVDPGDKFLIALKEAVTQADNLDLSGD